jgi:arylsulfatase A
MNPAICSFAAILLISAAVSHAGETAKPNILLIVTDDQGWWDLGANGNPHIDTPNLDRLARDGVRFERFYVEPVCSPTRAGLMTGRYYLRTGLYNTRFGGDSMAHSEVTVAGLLQRGGYRTGLFGKWHLGHYHGYQPQQRGFDEFLGHYHGHIERYEYADQLVHNGVPVETRGYVADLFTDAAMEFIAATTQQQKPFFCCLAFNTPHSPHQLDTSHDHQPEGDTMIVKYLQRGLPLREARIYAQVERIDQNVGRLLKHLDALGLAGNTVVAFMSDNGGVSKFWTGGMRGHKATVFEGGVRSPLLVRWPGHFPAGGRVEAQASHVDLLPTFCELASVPLPADRKIDGLSLLPLLHAGKGTEHHEFVYHTWNRFFPDPDHRWAISDTRYKLAANFGDQAKVSPAGWMLFDLVADPGERKNLAAQHPDKVKALRAEFERWFKEVTAGITYRPVPIPIGQPGENPVEVQASWATTLGENTRYAFNAYDWDTLEGWSKQGDAAEWKIEVTRAA